MTMPAMEKYAEGTPSWVDLMTTDPESAQAFYGALFGWEFQTNPTPDGQEYIMCTLNGSAAAGMGKQGQEQVDMGIPPMWNTYLTVDDIEATVAKVDGAGGSVMMPPMEVMDAGHMAVIVDSTGAVVCLWQPNQHVGCEIVNEPGALVWNELINNDVAAATTFYKAVVGLDSSERDMGAPDPYTVLMNGDAQVAGALNPPMDGIPNHWSVYFAVADADAAVVAATELGGSVTAPAFHIPEVGRIAGIQDPAGAMFWIMQMADQSSEG